MPRAVLDTTALVSAFLSAKPGGAAFELLQFAYAGRFELVLSEPILTEVADVLLTRPHLRTRYRYTDNAVASYVNGLRRAATLVTDLPELSVVRDKADVAAVTCACLADDRLFLRLRFAQTRVGRRRADDPNTMTTHPSQRTEQRDRSCSSAKVTSFSSTGSILSPRPAGTAGHRAQRLSRPAALQRPPQAWS